MTNRIDQLTSFVADNPLTVRVQNPTRTTVNPLARQVIAVTADSQTQAVATDPLPQPVPQVQLGDPEESVTEAELDSALALFQQQLITDIVTPLTARIQELEQTVALLEQRISALE